MNKNKTLLKQFFDKHYFTESVINYPIVFAKAKGNCLFDANNKKYIDLFSGMGTAFLGHNNKDISSYIIKQIKTISVSNYFPTKIKMDFIKEIQPILPKGTVCLTLFSTGAEAVEYAFRLARVISGKPELISFNKSLHGKTHAAAVSSWDHYSYGSFNLGFHRFKYPSCDHCKYSQKLCGIKCFIEFKNNFNKLPLNKIGAIIIEPIQGYSGGIIPPKEFFQKVVKLCKKNKLLLLYDEILTGLGRTGKIFGYQHFSGTVPDIIIIGKALGNGFPISAVICKKSYLKKAGFALPGSTYAGNPLACASGKAVIKYIKKNNIIKKAKTLENVMLHVLLLLKEDKNIFSIRGLGAFFVIEFNDEKFLKKIYPKFLDNGIAITYGGRFLRILPPITINKTELKKSLTTITNIIKDG